MKFFHKPIMSQTRQHNQTFQCFIYRSHNNKTMKETFLELKHSTVKHQLEKHQQTKHSMATQQPTTTVVSALVYE